MKLKLLYVVVLFSIAAINSQNLINTNSWTVGSGSVSGFGQHGVNSENIREVGSSPNFISEILWKAVPNNNGGASGGFSTNFYNIDHSKTYRFSIWLKKTNSNDGVSLFGCLSNSNSILNLTGTLQNDPYFLINDLPELNKWYLLVGYVHGNNYNSMDNYGGIYDVNTGEKISSLNDYKFNESALNVRLHSYLHNDSNTSDRQYFFDPRIDEVNGEEPSVEELLTPVETDNNLLDSGTWDIGCGSVLGFTQNGDDSENCREIGKNHVGEEVVLWKGGNDASSGPDGGWNTGWNSIPNNNLTYRFSVWIKKTNSNSGDTYFGFYADNSGSLTLNGTYNNNPYFFAYDLPKLNRWYLLVGYVHKSSHTGTTNLGRIYDGVTGEEVNTLTDYKLKNTVTQLKHRAYLYHSTNVLDRQYFWQPRIDPIDGTEPTITELLQINENSKLIISYDTAGNQKQRFYCEEEGFCSPSAPTSRRPEDDKVVENNNEEDAPVAPNPEEEQLEVVDYKHTIYPNPTKDWVSIKLTGKDYNLTGSLSIYNTLGSLIKKININEPKNNMDIDLSEFSSGTYFIHMHFSNGTTVTEQIIKN